MSEEISDTLRYAATKLTEEGEALLRQAIKSNDVALRKQAILSATAQFSAALALQPPPDTLVYVYIPPGEFLMGTTEDQMEIVLKQHDYELTKDDFQDEIPAHTVALSGFWIMRTEVTNAQYKRCVDAKVCEPPENSRWDKTQFAKQPVADVIWTQASHYAAWVGGRLPTEAEWEYACRGTDSRIYPWGDDAPTPERLNYSRGGFHTWTDVGSYPPGANGLYDMAGNVDEWTADRYGQKYYVSSPGRNPKGPDDGDLRMERGGSFYVNDFFVRCAARYVWPDVRFSYPGNYGFRVVSPGF